VKSSGKKNQRHADERVAAPKKETSSLSSDASGALGPFAPTNCTYAKKKHTHRRAEACAPHLGRDYPLPEPGSSSSSGASEVAAAEPAGQSVKDQKKAKGAFKVQAGSWVAEAKGWAPGCVQWGAQVAELYGHTEVKKRWVGEERVRWGGGWVGGLLGG
jgi:hypothetical protein